MSCGSNEMPSIVRGIHTRSLQLVVLFGEGSDGVSSLGEVVSEKIFEGKTLPDFKFTLYASCLRFRVRVLCSRFLLLCLILDVMLSQALWAPFCRNHNLG